MKADWVSATVATNPQEVFDALMGTYVDLLTEPSPPQKGYETATTFTRHGTYFCDLSQGGRNGETYGPHLVAKSKGAPDVFEFLRTYWPDDHQIARLDVAHDFYTEGFFDDTIPIVLDIARNSHRPMKPNQQGNWLEPPYSRTLNLGSRGSVAHLRMYEKTQQMRDKNPHGPSVIPDNWVRVEIEVKPQTPKGKKALAYAPLEQAWGAALWSREFCSRVIGQDVEKMDLGSKRAPLCTEDEMFLRYLRMSAKTIVKLSNRVGGYDAFQDLVYEELVRRGHHIRH
jgi:hypothetical protein